MSCVLIALAGCGLSRPALWGVSEGSKLMVGLVGSAVEALDGPGGMPSATDSGSSAAGSGPLVTESDAATTKPTEGYNPLDPTGAAADTADASPAGAE